MQSKQDKDLGWISKALDRVRAPLLALNERFEQPEAQLVQIRDEAKDLLRENGLLRRARANSKYIGVHPANRYGDGVVPSDVLALIAEIFSQ